MFVALLGLAVAAPPAAASQPRPDRAQALHASLRAGNAGYGLLGGFRHRTARGISLGVDAESVYIIEAFIGGFAVPSNLRVAGRVPFQFPVLHSERLTLALTVAPGFRWTRSLAADAPERTSVAVTADVGAFAYLHRDRFSWTAGIDNPISVQVRPITDVDTLGTLLVTGPIVPITERLHWYATVEAGGVFGSDGDAGKFLLRGTTGIRGFFGPTGSSWRAYY
ncbi:MAG: hypothetical protein AAF721_20840 [Myxococcota bacterium]